MKNIRYAIVTLDGFVMDEQIGGMRIFHQADHARPYMKPGNVLVPIKDENQQADYESGKLRTPSVNRFGRSSTGRMPGQPR
jgi:hypothetical protein